MKRFYTTRTIGLIMFGVLLAMWLAGEALFRWLLPEYRLAIYPAIPALFIVFAVVLILLTALWDRKVRAGAMLKQKAVGGFMMLKTAKLLVSLAAVFCYVQFVGAARTAFLMTFLAYYLVFLGLETFAIYNFDRRHKND